MLYPIQFSASVQVNKKAILDVQDEEYADRLNTAAEKALKESPLDEIDSVKLEFTTVPKLKIIGPIKIGGPLGKLIGKIDEKTNDAADAVKQKADEKGITDKIPNFPGRGLIVKIAKGRVTKKVVKRFPAVRAASILTRAENDECLSIEYENQFGDREQEIVEKKWHWRRPEKWAKKAISEAEQIIAKDNAQ